MRMLVVLNSYVALQCCGGSASRVGATRSTCTDRHCSSFNAKMAGGGRAKTRDQPRIQDELVKELCREELEFVPLLPIRGWCFSDYCPIHTEREHKFSGKSFDVACIQCEHSHMQLKVPVAFERGIASPRVQCGLGLHACVLTTWV